MKKLSFKYKALLGFIGAAIFLVALQSAMQFISDYKFVGFIKKNGGWQGIAAQAQAEKWTCQQELDQANAQLEEVKKMRDEINQDILKPIK